MAVFSFIPKIAEIRHSIVIRPNCSRSWDQCRWHRFMIYPFELNKSLFADKLKWMYSWSRCTGHTARVVSLSTSVCFKLLLRRKYELRPHQGHHIQVVTTAHFRLQLAVCYRHYGRTEFALCIRRLMNLCAVNDSLLTQNNLLLIFCILNVLPGYKFTFPWRRQFT